MDRTDLQRLSKDELIELVIQLQRPDKTSRTSSKAPSTDKKERRENSRPGGAKPGHEPHNRRLADNPDEFRDHRPTHCELCGGCRTRWPSNVVTKSYPTSQWAGRGFTRSWGTHRV